MTGVFTSEKTCVHTCSELKRRDIGKGSTFSEGERPGEDLLFPVLRSDPPAHTLTLETCLQICETMNVCCLSCLGCGAVSWQPEQCNVWEAKISLGLHRSWWSLKTRQNATKEEFSCEKAKGPSGHSALTGEGEYHGHTPSYSGHPVAIQQASSSTYPVPCTGDRNSEKMSLKKLVICRKMDRTRGRKVKPRKINMACFPPYMKSRSKLIMI
jgi:hypothetical protein